MAKAEFYPTSQQTLKVAKQTSKSFHKGASGKLQERSMTQFSYSPETTVAPKIGNRLFG